MYIPSIITERLENADYDVILEDVDCSQVNEEYIKTCDFELNYDSTYGASLNSYMEIIKSFPEDVKLIADVFTVRMGEYSVDLGLHIETNFCEIISDSNSIALPMIKAINFDSLDNCPPAPGVYQGEDYVIDSMDGLPPSFPNGHYLVNMSLLNKDTTLVHFDIYVRIY
ncbi:uncharacterized protein LOC122529078 isoform X2 [Frieseomelitta varia]|uniref:uncharacterized protein LOC122529078 isoform X2 n=1 Tax=Frieseomelitta varia TaxID=561572 RepID=UPI001CB6ABEA|nr:uncharacterized protein LOC122529078 isoform X2 [Frieseomelitta varia]